MVRPMDTVPCQGRVVPLIPVIMTGLLCLGTSTATTSTVSPLPQLTPWNLTFSPPNVTQLQEGSLTSVTLTASRVGVTATADKNTTMSLEMEFTEPGIAEFGDQGLRINLTGECADVSCILSGNFTIQGTFLGYTSITFRQDHSDQVHGEILVSVVRVPRAITKVFNYLTIALFAIVNISFGCQVNLSETKILLKKPIVLIIGFLCQYLGMPTLAYLFGRALLTPSLAFGLLAVGASPGGGPSNIWCLHLAGDVNLSLCMTFISTLAALGMLPLWMLTLGTYILGSDTSIPFLNMIGTLALFVIPLVGGVLLAYYLPRVGKLMEKIIKPLTIIVVLIVAGVGIYSESYIFRLVRNWRLIVASLLLPYSGLILSALVAALLRQPRKRVITICIETSIQNGGIALILLRTSLPQPDADLTTIVPLLVMSFTPAPLLIALIVKTIYTKCCQTTSVDINVPVDDRHTQTGQGGELKEPGSERYLAKVNKGYESDTSVNRM